MTETDDNQAAARNALDLVKELRDRAEKAEAQLQRVREFHEAWGNQDMDVALPLVLWEDLGWIIKGPAC